MQIQLDKRIAEKLEILSDEKLVVWRHQDSDDVKVNIENAIVALVKAI